MQELKRFQRRSMQIAGTGIGLSVLAGVSPDADTSKAIGIMGKGLSPISTITLMDAQMSMLDKFGKTKRKHNII